MDTNLVVLTGTKVSAAERTVGPSGRTLTELRLAVTRPGRKGEAEPPMVVPVTIWADVVGIAVRELAEGTPLTVVGRLQAREWKERLYLELVADAVTVDVTAGPDAPPPSPSRPIGRPTPRPTATDVPF
jgi:single-stranded DNA-binding protein